MAHFFGAPCRLTAVVWRRGARVLQTAEARRRVSDGHGRRDPGSLDHLHGDGVHLQRPGRHASVRLPHSRPHARYQPHIRHRHRSTFHSPTRPRPVRCWTQPTVINDFDPAQPRTAPEITIAFMTKQYGKSVQYNQCYCCILLRYYEEHRALRDSHIK